MTQESELESEPESEMNYMLTTDHSSICSQNIPASVKICDRIGAGGHIPVKHLADSDGSRYNGYAPVGIQPCRVWPKMQKALAQFQRQR